MKRIAILAATLTFAAAGAQYTSASQLSIIEFSGTVDDYLRTGIPTGTPVAGTVTFRRSVEDIDPSPSRGEYITNVEEFTLILGDEQFTWHDVLGDIRVVDESSVSHDEFRAFVRDTFIELGGVSLTGFAVALDSQDGSDGATLFSDDSLPLTGFAPPVITSQLLYFNSTRIRGGPVGTAVLDQLTLRTIPIPEPTTLTLAGLGLVAAAWWWRNSTR